ncbi:hypothetical protein L1887_34095 [Cichorium endivia]|nr:hypothetical protein L1887_34095 [Cichorium endivia]
MHDSEGKECCLYIRIEFAALIRLLAIRVFSCHQGGASAPSRFVFSGWIRVSPSAQQLKTHAFSKACLHTFSLASLMQF